MTDVIDDACKTEAKFQQMALASQLARARAVANLESQTYCLECGEEIPQARRAAQRGCKYCIECQQARE
jgi:phage/conjugal plasmid C-4 type zinc finger TraR family protein